MEEDAGQLRSVANVMRAAGCDVPDWMLALKKERHHSKPKPPAAGGISTEPRPQGEGKHRQGGEWRDKHARPGGKQGGGGTGKGKQQGGGGSGKREQQRPRPAKQARKE